MKEDGKPVHYSYNEDYFLDFIQPTIETLMVVLITLGAVLDFVIWRVRVAPGWLIFTYEIIYFVVENNLPLDYGLYSSYVITM